MDVGDVAAEGQQSLKRMSRKQRRLEKQRRRNIELGLAAEPKMAEGEHSITNVRNDIEEHARVTSIRLKEVDAEDKAREKARVKAKHRAQREAAREAMRTAAAAEGGAAR